MGQTSHLQGCSLNGLAGHRLQFHEWQPHRSRRVVRQVDASAEGRGRGAVRPVLAAAVATASLWRWRGHSRKGAAAARAATSRPNRKPAAEASPGEGEEPGLEEEPRLLGRLLVEFREQARPRLLVPATLISMSLSGTSALRAFLSGRLLDLAVSRSATSADFAPVAALYFAAALYGYAANVVQGILFALARWNMSMSMRQKLFGDLLRQEVRFFESNSSGALVSRLTNDTDQMQRVLNRAPETLVTNLLRCVMSWVLMAKQHLLLASVSVIPIPFAWFLIRKTGRAVGRFGIMQNDALARVNAVASEAISNVRAVQLAGAEETEKREYGSAVGKYLEVIRRTLFVETALRFLSTLVNDAFTDVPLMCLCCWLISRGELSVGQFYTYRTLLFSYRRGFRELAELFTGVSRAQAVSKRYFEITDRTPAVRSCPGAVQLQPDDVSGLLELDAVSFKYPGQEHWALREITLRVEPGQIVALVGPSGAGKSTVLRLCARLMDPEVGHLRLDGHDLQELDLGSLRRCFGFVDQDPALFDRSVRANIAYGLMDGIPGPGGESRSAALDGAKDDAWVRSAATAACAVDFIEALPEGFSARLGERGSRLSGGQRQRLVLARAIARGARVLLLDEPTSALDGECETAITEALVALAAQGCAILVAAHRVGTVARADHIVVLEGGCIVEQGRRETLLSSPNSRYKAIVEPSLGL